MSLLETLLTSHNDQLKEENNYKDLLIKEQNETIQILEARIALMGTAFTILFNKVKEVEQKTLDKER